MKNLSLLLIMFCMVILSACNDIQSCSDATEELKEVHLDTLKCVKAHSCLNNMGMPVFLNPLLNTFDEYLAYSEQLKPQYREMFESCMGELANATIDDMNYDITIIEDKQVRPNHYMCTANVKTNGLGFKINKDITYNMVVDNENSEVNISLMY